MPRSPLLLLLAITIASGQTKTPAAVLVADDVPVLLTDQGGTVTVPISIHNAGTEPVMLRLNVSDFEHKPATGGPYPLGATFSWSAIGEADKSVLNGMKPLEANHAITAKLTVARLWEAGESTATLKNGEADIPTTSGAKICVLRALHIPEGFNLRIDAAGNPPEIRFASLGVGRDKVLVHIVNGDAMSYRVRWALRLDDEMRSAPNPYLDIPANGSVFLDLSPVAPAPDGVFSWVAQLLASGTLKDEIRDGDIVLTPVLASANVPPIAPKVLPVTGRLRFWSEGFQDFMNIVCVFLLLTLGGVASIWVHCGMPNTTRALQGQRRLRALNAQIDGLGTDLPSHWRVLLAAQPKSLSAELASMWWVFPGFAEVLSRVEKRLTMVEAWGAVAYDVSIVQRQTHQQLQDGIPPTVLNWIESACEQALMPIETGLTNDEEVQGMRTAIRSAHEYLQLVVDGKQIPDLEQEIAQRETRLKQYLQPGKRIWPPEFSNLVAQVAAAIGTPMSPDLYIERDTLTTKVDLLNGFIDLYERAMSGAPAVAAMAAGAGSGSSIHAPESALTRLIANRDRLFSYLRPDAAESLRLARLFLAEMRQDIYEPALITEIQKPSPALKVYTEPAVVMPDAPVHFALRFDRNLLNEAAACQEWTCTWRFNDGTATETGWEVHHSFAAPGVYSIAIEIADLRGNPVTQKSITSTLSVGRDAAAPHSSTVVRWRQRMADVLHWWKPHAETMLEASRLALVLAVAVFGLVATARQQAATLTLPEAVGAVIALGFGADTLKNLITDRRVPADASSR